MNPSLKIGWCWWGEEVSFQTLTSRSWRIFRWYNAEADCPRTPRDCCRAPGRPAGWSACTWSGNWWSLLRNPCPLESWRPLLSSPLRYSEWYFGVDRRRTKFRVDKSLLQGAKCSRTETQRPNEDQQRRRRSLGRDDEGGGGGGGDDDGRRHIFWPVVVVGIFEGFGHGLYTSCYCLDDGIFIFIRFY